MMEPEYRIKGGNGGICHMANAGLKVGASSPTLDKNLLDTGLTMIQ